MKLMELYESIPSLDLADFRCGSERKEGFVKQLGEAFAQVGFVAIKNHGLSDAMSQNLYRVVQDFFSLDEAVKLKYDGSALAGQRGYTPKGREHAKGRNVGDLKEFYHIGQPHAQGLYPENIFPDEIPDFKAATLQVFEVLEQTGLELLRAIALHLGLEEGYFDDKVKQGNSILRPIHYFPILDPSSVPADAVRAAEHGDINLITLLMGASAEGLEILRKDGKWISVTALAEQIVVNVGDMLERLTNNRLRSSIHRVVNPAPEKMHLPRYSIPFFMHPKSEMSLACLPQCIDNQNPKQYPDITAGEFLNQRLREIGLIK
jgi:isopenicillin N synthase-like dioxygenase